MLKSGVSCDVACELLDLAPKTQEAVPKVFSAFDMIGRGVAIKSAPPEFRPIKRIQDEPLRALDCTSLAILGSIGPLDKQLFG